MRKISPSRVTVLCLLWAMVVLVAHQFGLGLLVREELASLDSRFRIRGVRAASPDIVILAVDQRSMVADTFTPEDLAAQPQLALLKNYPFPRRVYADAIEKLCNAGARVVAFDLLFLSPKEDDPGLRAVIEKYRDRIVLGSNFSDDGRRLLLPSVVVPESIPTESVAGYVNYWPDFDGVVRRERSRTTVSAVAHVEPAPGEQPVSSFTALAARRTAPDGLINFAGPSGT